MVEALYGDNRRLGQPSNAFRTLRTQSCGRARTSCSQIRTTLHPLRRSRRDTFLSRRTFLSNLRRQKCAFCAGEERCIGQRCQKHPSMNTATRSCRNTKSGRTAVVPISFERAPRITLPCRRQPLTAFERNSLRMASSVDLFPYAPMRAITSERCRGVRTSAIVRNANKVGRIQEVCPSPYYGVHPAAIASIMRLACSLRLLTSTPYAMTCAPVTASPYSLT